MEGSSATAEGAPPSIERRKVDLAQRTAEWHAWRRCHIGGSDVPAILGLSPYAGPWTVWAVKTGRVAVTPDPAAARRMEAGELLEPVILRWWSEETGRRVEPGEVWEAADDLGWWLGASLDAIADDGRIVEAKFSLRRWTELPPHVEALVVWQLGVSGRERATVVAWHGGELGTWEVAADPDRFHSVLRAVRRWWDAAIVAGREPDATPADAPALDARPSAGDQEAVPATAEVALLVEELLALKAEERSVADRVARVEALLRQALADTERVAGEGWTLTYATHERRNVAWQEYATELASRLRAAGLEVPPTERWERRQQLRPLIVRRTKAG
jgi:putative phage-type endonuclease